MPPTKRYYNSNLLIYIDDYSPLRIFIPLRSGCMCPCYRESFLFTLRAAMYVCVCRAVTDAEIREAASGGTRDLDGLNDTLGVGACCGTCRDTAQAIIDEHLAEAVAHAA